MILFIIFISTLIVSLLQTAGVIIPLVLPWVLAMGVTFPKKSSLVWAFSAGLLVDFIRGNMLGTSSIFYLAVVAMMFLVLRFLPKRNFFLFSFLLIVFELAAQLIFVGGVSAWRLLAGVMMFWILMPFASRLGELARGAMTVKLRQ